MSQADQDPRVAITTRIWALATGMMALCIPMVGISDDLAVLPLMVIIGTAVSTAVIWRSSQRRSDDTALLTQSIQELQRELARLQITSHDEDLRRKIEELQMK
jgi:membrane protein implicated in regulation of membrane protease activity